MNLTAIGKHKQVRTANTIKLKKMLYSRREMLEDRSIELIDPEGTVIASSPFALATSAQ
jgi:hypothetical protein